MSSLFVCYNVSGGAFLRNARVNYPLAKEHGLRQIHKDFTDLYDAMSLC